MKKTRILRAFFTEWNRIKSSGLNKLQRRRGGLARASAVNQRFSAQLLVHILQVLPDLAASTQQGASQVLPALAAAAQQFSVAQQAAVFVLL